MQKIVPHLWFDDQAEAAARFYASLFDQSTIGRISRYGREGQEVHGQPEGKAMSVEFSLAGLEIIALNGGPGFTFTPAISLFVVLETEAEVDALWGELSRGGSVLMPLQKYDWSDRYGWLNDRYGLSWQIMLGRHGDVGQTVTPSLLFVGRQSGRAEEAMKLYTSIFDESSVEGVARHDGSGADAEGAVKHAQFRLNGQTFMAMDSAFDHDFTFNEAFSFMVRCDDQEEIDRYWDALSAVPEAERCGWLKDPFGLSWQIIPSILPQLIADPDPEAAGRVMNAMLAMTRIDVETLRQAHGNSRPEA